MIVEHFTAVQQRLRTNADLAGILHDTARLDNKGALIRENYAILLGAGPDSLDDDRLSLPQRTDADAVFVYTFRSVGTTPARAREIAALGFTTLVGAELEVPGRLCQPIRHTWSDDVTPDFQAVPALYYCDDEYTLSSSRA